MKYILAVTVTTLLVIAFLAICYTIVLFTPLERYLPSQINFYNNRMTVVGVLVFIVVLLNIISVQYFKK